MEANEVPKSKFVYPDKLYARCKNNKTLDMSYAPQNMEAVEYTRADAFIEKACEFLSNEANIPLWEDDNTFGCDTTKLIENFKNYMKGE